MNVELSDQVVAFVRSQAPEPRRRLRLALRNLASGKGDIKPLQGTLRSYNRLRVGPYRIVFACEAPPGRPGHIWCLFAERRDTVYAVASDMLKRRLLE